MNTQPPAFAFDKSWVEKLGKMKTCLACGKEFGITHKGSGGHNRDYCYDCYPHGLSRQERYALRKELAYQRGVREKLSRGCDICGYNKCPTALEWHHPEDNKEYNPSDLLRDGTYKKYQEETQKCQLLCANCHRELHFKE